MDSQLSNFFNIPQPLGLGAQLHGRHHHGAEFHLGLAPPLGSLPGDFPLENHARVIRWEKPQLHQFLKQVGSFPWTYFGSPPIWDFMGGYCILEGFGM